jgi:predicted DNA binding CopG/RHH family protein
MTHCMGKEVPMEEPKIQDWEIDDYTDDPDLPDIKDLRLVSKDFLPRPEELVFKKPIRKVTIALDQESIDFFKAEAQRLRVPYQRMIRMLVQEYVERAKHRQAPTPS